MKTLIISLFLLINITTKASTIDSIVFRVSAFSSDSSTQIHYIIVPKKTNYICYKTYTKQNDYLQPRKPKLSNNKIKISTISIQKVEELVSLLSDSNYTLPKIENFGISSKYLHQNIDKLITYGLHGRPYWNQAQKDFLKQQLLLPQSYQDALNLEYNIDGKGFKLFNGGVSYTTIVYKGTDSLIVRSRGNNLLNLPWDNAQFKIYNPRINQILTEIKVLDHKVIILPRNKEKKISELKTVEQNIDFILSSKIYEIFEKNIKRIAANTFPNDIQFIANHFTIIDTNEDLDYYHRDSLPIQWIKLVVQNDKMFSNVFLEFTLKNQKNKLQYSDELMKFADSIAKEIQDIPFIKTKFLADSNHIMTISLTPEIVDKKENVEFMIRNKIDNKLSQWTFLPDSKILLRYLNDKKDFLHIPESHLNAKQYGPLNILFDYNGNIIN